MPVYLTETIHDHCGTFEQFWHCPPPDLGAEFVVTRQEWNDELTERHIYAVEVYA